MKKIKIFLASSNELKSDREKFAKEINRKKELWNEKNISLHLDIWEDLSARMSPTRSQDEYNQKVREADLFVLLAYSKVGMYTEEEFDIAFGTFQKTKKPFIFTYFKEIETDVEDSLEMFKNKLNELGHFYSSYSNFDNLWKQFNIELDRLLLANFDQNDIKTNKTEKIIIQNAERIYNIDKSNTAYLDSNGKKNLGAIPATPALFIGRDNSTKEIHEKLNKNDHLLLLVNGQGGIGKTTLASQYYFEYAAHYSHLIWLVSENGIKEAIVSLALSLDIVFAKNLTESQRLNEVVRVVLGLNKPILLIIDNANNIADLDENFQLLRKFHNVHILITSRINNYEQIATYKVKHLSKKYANELFKQHFKSFKSEEQGLLDALLEAIGYNTLVIELLAKNLSEFNTAIKEHYPLEKLLKDIQEKGVLAISRSTKVNADYKLEKSRPEDIIRTMYNVSHLSENEKHILSIFAVLPATAMPFHYLEQFLPKIEELDRVLLKLSQKGWIEYDEKYKIFKTNPIISEIARKQNKDRIEKDIWSLLLFLIDKLKYELGGGHIEGDFDEIKKLVLYAETFVSNFEILNHNKSVLFERLGNFYQTYGNLDRALQFYEDDLNLMKELSESHPNNVDFKNGLAISYSKLGNTHTSLGNLEAALKFYEDYLNLRKELLESDLSNVSFKNGLAISYSKLGNTHSSLGNLETALKFYEDYLKLTKELSESHPSNVGFKNGLAISYAKLGETHSSLGNLETALQFYEDDLKLMKELSESHPSNVVFKNGLAISYEKLGETHTSLGNLEMALQFYEDDLKLREELYESHPNNVGFKNGLGISYEKLGETHTSLGNLETALQFYEDYLNLSKELFESHPSNVVFKNGLAISYEKLGNTHTSLGNLEAALKFYEDDLKLTKELYESHPTKVSFKNGLAISYSKLGNTHIYLGNLETALKFYEDDLKLREELYESHPTNVHFKNGLGISYLKLGILFVDELNDKKKGINLLKKAETIFKELKDAHPSYVEFGRNYDVVVGVLAEL